MSGTVTNDTFPIRLDPIAGESFDGWLDAYAQRLLIPTRELAQALNLPPQLLRQRAMTLAKGVPELDASEIAARACQLDPAAIGALWAGLSRYDRLIARQVAACGARHGAVRRFARMLRPMVWSRYCPECLRQTGRWLAAWRLPWYLACPTHRIMLATGCPACGARQRVWAMRATYRPNLLTACCRDVAGGRDARCGQDLTSSTHGTSAPADLITFVDQTRPVLDTRVDDEHANTLVERLIETIIIASRIVAHGHALRHDRPTFEPALAAALTDAHLALRDPDGHRMRTIALNAGRVSAGLPATWDGVSPALAAAVIKHRDPHLRTAERLRYRSMTDNPRPPEPIDPETRMRAIPVALWPDWSIRMRPPRIRPDRFRIVAAILLCLPGRTLSLPTICEVWPGSAKKKRMKHFFNQLAADPHGNAILAALCALADALDRDGSPIDYERRRELAGQIELLDPHAWTVICHATGALVGHGAKLAHARLWLWETITGGLADQAPPHLALRPNSPAFLDIHTRFTRQLSATMTRHLNDHARELLDIHGASHEPLSWSPSVNAVAIDALPGADPDAINADDVHAAIRNQPTRRHAAAKLGITLEHLQHIVRTQPPDREHHPPPAPARARLAAAVRTDELRQLIEDGTTLKQIQATYGIGYRTLRDELLAHDIPFPTTRRRHSPPGDCPSIPDRGTTEMPANVHQ